MQLSCRAPQNMQCRYQVIPNENTYPMAHLLGYCVGVFVLKYLSLSAHKCLAATRTAV